MNDKKMQLAICLNILDWFDDPLLDYINHIALKKVDAMERFYRALPTLTEHCRNLVAQAAQTDRAYPETV
jgi:hypothetical protein